MTRVKQIIMNKKITLTTLLIATSFFFGFAFKTFITPAQTKPRVTGIGGIFFKCKDPKKLKAWYKNKLGFNTNDYGAVFEWYQGADSTKKGFTQWSPFNEKTKYFAPSTKDFMINYRVENLVEFVKQLRRDSVIVVDSIEVVDYGKFVHILDLEGNKLELWEPNDVEYEKLGITMGLKTNK